MTDESSEDYATDEAFRRYASAIDTEKDKLAVVIHLIMTRSGFKYSADEECDFKQTRGAQFNKIFYDQIRSDFKSREVSYYRLKSNLIVILLQSGNSVDISVKYLTFMSSFLKLNLNEFFNEPKFYIAKKLNLNSVSKQFEIKFKDALLNPVKFFLKSTELTSELNFINGLCDLPVELIVRLTLTYLDIHSIVKLTKLNKNLYNLINSNVSSTSSVWFKLIRRDFNRDFNLTDVDFRVHYIKLYHSRRLFNKKIN